MFQSDTRGQLGSGPGLRHTTTHKNSSFSLFSPLNPGEPLLHVSSWSRPETGQLPAQAGRELASLEEKQNKGEKQLWSDLKVLLKPGTSRVNLVRMCP